MRGQTEPNFSPADTRSDLTHADPRLGEFLGSFAPQAPELGFEPTSRRRSGVTLAIIVGCAVVGLTGYELLKYLSRRREKCQAVRPDPSG
ncbi:MAG: hypothetical protein EHM23_05750 [Acidobacteria bacterium]|nr:MAG: hypothetical protein EHM23_05750 [Acidobacteriota bacterium]